MSAIRYREYTRCLTDSFPFIIGGTHVFPIHIFKYAFFCKLFKRRTQINVLKLKTLFLYSIEEEIGIYFFQTRYVKRILLAFLLIYNKKKSFNRSKLRNVRNLQQVINDFSDL